MIALTPIGKIGIDNLPSNGESQTGPTHGIGAFIGTVSLFFLFQVFLKLRQQPVIGFLSNFLVVAVLTLAGAILNGIRTYRQYIYSRWFMVLIVAEFLSFS